MRYYQRTNKIVNELKKWKKMMFFFMMLVNVEIQLTSIQLSTIHLETYTRSPIYNRHRMYTIHRADGAFDSDFPSFSSRENFKLFNADNIIPIAPNENMSECYHS